MGSRSCALIGSRKFPTMSRVAINAFKGDIIAEIKNYILQNDDTDHYESDQDRYRIACQIVKTVKSHFIVPRVRRQPLSLSPLHV